MALRQPSDRAGYRRNDRLPTFADEQGGHMPLRYWGHAPKWTGQFLPELGAKILGSCRWDRGSDEDPHQFNG